MTHLGIAGRALRVSYLGGPVVLAGATVTVEPHCRTALLGANGSGKTTLLRCLAGAVEPEAGRVEICDETLKYSRAGLRAHRQRVQLVLQDPDDQLFSADVERDVAYGPSNLGLADSDVRDRVDEALALMGIEHLRRRPTHHLSYGERKRVATAGAVAMRPAVLLLDEPTAGLDPVGVDEMFGALDRLEKAQTTVLLSTHDVDLALRWADSVAVVVDGVVHQGLPDAVLSDAALVSRARLKMPWASELAEELVRAGMIAPDARPHTVEDVMAALRLGVSDG
ncbi:MAG: energy-coupling factor ABC transporter ATP-binding protein [Rhodococcus sp. (in: high G+C Gram-positive bacteria)]